MIIKYGENRMVNMSLVVDIKLNTKTINDYQSWDSEIHKKEVPTIVFSYSNKTDDSVTWYPVEGDDIRDMYKRLLGKFTVDILTHEGAFKQSIANSYCFPRD